MSENDVIQCPATVLVETEETIQGPRGNQVPLMGLQVCTLVTDHEGDHEWSIAPLDLDA